MSIKLQKTDDEYYVIVNRGELYRQARKLKFRNSVFMKNDLSDADIDVMKDSGKVFVLVFFSENEDYGREIEIRMRRAGINTFLWDILIDGDDPDRFEKPKSIKDAVSAFPNRTAVETMLVCDGLIHDTDYANRCGNCSAKMATEDNYCKYCGTKRGEGAFEPFMNPMYCLYGPPISRKYVCNKCGHKWITNALGGGGECRFCPKCGNSDTEIVQTKLNDFGDVIGLVPDEESDNSQLLSEEQVLAILDTRAEAAESYEEEKCLLKAGIEEASRANDSQHLTEAEGKRLTLARQLLILTKGNDVNAFRGRNICCPKCESKLIAAISYPLVNDPYDDKEDEESIFNGKHVSGNGNEVVLRSGAIVDWDNLIKGEEWADRGQAFICMQCGERFGRFEEYY